MEKPNISAEKANKYTIPEISDALMSVLQWNVYQSPEMMEAIKEIYDLVEKIYSHNIPSDLSRKLDLASHDMPIFLKQLQDWLDKWYIDDVYCTDKIRKVVEKYIEIFSRGWKDLLKYWNIILSTYNPARMKELKKHKKAIF